MCFISGEPVEACDLLLVLEKQVQEEVGVGVKEKQVAVGKDTR